MKNLLIASAVAVALCGTAFADNSTNMTSTTAMPAATAMQMTTATATITTKGTKTLVASGTISWASGTSDKLAVTWTGPGNTRKGDCRDTTHHIAMGELTYKVERTPWYKQANGTPMACKGVWTAAVVNLTTGKTLASTQYTVK